jgi:hypothetical protein
MTNLTPSQARFHLAEFSSYSSFLIKGFDTEA